VDSGGHLRASDADREHVVDRLHKAATEGRIASEELEHRVSAALKALTYSELEATVSDLPSAQTPRRRATRPAVGVARWGVSVVRANPIMIVFMIPVLAVTLAMVIAAMTLWVVLVTVAMLLGHRSRHMGRISARRYGPHSGRRGPRGSWI
jgi:hypothetical protein